ncbi:ABC transporter ATP-binding protein [Gracilimonas sediminicola]|uniref:ABC transporter ATP-binding protein n=1 Tax=Gracilimonas sediminicola TaxID=2952158 RepID=UPI0038D3E762
MSKPTIQTENLTRKFGDFTAVDKITFEVEQGEIFGFLGANGAGKTTAMRMLTGLLTPTSGKALVSGKDVYRQAEAIKKNIGYMSQKFSLYDDLTSEENIRFYGGIYGIPDKELNSKIDEVINSLGLKDVRKKLVRSLPLGWKQKLAFSIAILHNPNIVFLDEPTGGVDPVTRRQFWEKIYEVSDRGITVFVTTHYMDEAEYCDRISIMVDGRMDAIGSPRELKENLESDSIEDVFIKLARGAERREG